MEDKVKLLETCEMEEFQLCELDGRYDYFYECMPYSTGVIKLFDLKKYESGFILRRPDRNNLITLSILGFLLMQEALRISEEDY